MERRATRDCDWSISLPRYDRYLPLAVDVNTLQIGHGSKAGIVAEEVFRPARKRGSRMQGIRHLQRRILRAQTGRLDEERRA